MNHKNVKIPKHIDPREFVREEPTAEIINLSLMMKESGYTPYRYIRRAMKYLVNGDYDNASNELKYADKFSGVFWKPKSSDNEAFDLTISVLTLQFYFLIEMFKKLRPEE